MMPANAHAVKSLLVCALKNQKFHQQNIKKKKIKMVVNKHLAHNHFFFGVTSQARLTATLRAKVF